MKVSKYIPSRDKFSTYCSKPNCNEDHKVCTAIMDDGAPCGQIGHPDLYKCDEDHVVPIIEHAHFLPNKDIGRNTFHKVGKPLYAPQTMRVYTWRTYRGPDRWKKVPESVRKALGWDIND